MVKKGRYGINRKIDVLLLALGQVKRFAAIKKFFESVEKNASNLC